MLIRNDIATYTGTSQFSKVWYVLHVIRCPKSLNSTKILLPGILNRQMQPKHAHKWKRHHKCTK